MNAKETIRINAAALGFDVCGFTSDFMPTHADYFQQWVAERRYAGMTWLGQNTNKRLHPDQILPDTKTAILLAISYHHSADSSDAFQVAQYAHGEDYHIWMKEKLECLAKQIQNTLKPDLKWKSFVDTGPVLERDLAAKAGLGWVGKNTCLIHKNLGSFLFLGEIFCDLELLDDLPSIDHCGHCRLCLDACPTQALVPYQLEAQKCLAYQNIEKRGERDFQHWQNLGDHLVGCDICQDVCPWNQHVQPSRQEDWLQSFATYAFTSLKDLLEIAEKDFKARFKTSPISRVKYSDFMRNVFLVIANLRRTDLAENVEEWIRRNPDYSLGEAVHCLKILRTKL